MSNAPAPDASTEPFRVQQDQADSQGSSGNGRSLGAYSLGSQAYLNAGWSSPIPVGNGRRNAPPKGVTGEYGREATPQDVAGWCAARGNDAVALRLPPGVIGIDVDAHDGKAGLETLRALEARYGALPDTWSSTSREDGSRIMFFQAPGHVTVLLRDLGPGIEVIRRAHRYAVVWPSVSEKTERMYRWYRPGGEAAPDGRVPGPGELAQLPEGWYAAVALDGAQGGAAGFGGVGTGKWTNPAVDALLEHGVPAGMVQDEVLKDLVWKLVAEGQSDAQIQIQWIAVVGRTPQLNPDKPWTDADFRRHLAGARAKLGEGAPPMDERPDWARPRELREKGADGGSTDEIGRPDRPMTAARALEERDHTDAEGRLTRRFWRGSFYQWETGYWRELTDSDVRAELYLKTEHAFYLSKNKEGKESATPWAPTSVKINNLTQALAAVLNTRAEVDQGSWFDGRENGIRLVACRNVLVDPLTGKAETHTPAYFNGYALDFDYDPHTSCPAWLGFLESVWPGDSASKLLLQQWFGYVLSGRTNLQKMMYMKGLKRSGKGTIARILTALLGQVNVSGPDFESFGRGFGMELLVNCQLAVVGDARYTGDRRTMQNAISKLLSITGEDKINVDRKNKQEWTGTLPTRLMLMSNEMPGFRDSSGAIVDRMLLLVFKQSFIGKEDITLETRLKAELPGIFNWALAGYRELVAADGRFARPAASAEVLDDFRKVVSPMEAWLNTECSLEAETVRESVPWLRHHWERYCAENDYRPGASNTFLSLVQTVWPSVGATDNKITDQAGRRVRAWTGIRYRGLTD